MKRIQRSLPAAVILWFLAFGGISGYAQEPQMTVPELGYGSPDTFAEFHGYVNLLYFDFEKDADRNGRGDSSFDQHYFAFNALAKIRHNVMILGEIEYEHGGEEMVIDRAYIQWGIYEEYLNIRLGKFYAPFGLELREYQYPVRKLVSRPMMARNLLFNEWTEVGINLYGRLNIPNQPFSIDYDLALVNGPSGRESGDADSIPEILEVGTGANPNTGGTADARQNRDNNSNRTLISRLSLNILGAMGVGVSYGGGRYSDAGSPNLDFSLIGVDVNFRMKGLDLRGEWVTRRIDLAPTTDRDSFSYYIQIAYKQGFGRAGLNYIEPVARYDFLEPDQDAANDQRQRISLGINYSPYPHFKFGAEWQMNNEEGPEQEDDGFLLQAVVDF
jgi:hypothetical protein